jgi:hypothetical protein
LADFEEDIHCRRVVVFPLVLKHLVFELFVVILAVAQVYNEVFILMLVLEEGSNL